MVDQLLGLYTELGDYRGMVQLYEDQILRGKDPNVRAELARKVARLWEERLEDPREAADAWRRVLRMKPGDPEGTEGLERAKTNMLKRPKSEPVTSQPEGTTSIEPATLAPQRQPLLHRSSRLLPKRLPWRRRSRLPPNRSRLRP